LHNLSAVTTAALLFTNISCCACDFSHNYEIVKKNYGQYGQYGVPHGVPQIFINVYDENDFKILKFLRQTLSLSPEQSTLKLTSSKNCVDPLG
jgi:hypothetical protein